MKKKGFTLVELLAVIVVLSIVLMIAVAGYQKYISYTKQKAFNLEEKNFLSAARSAYADCLANKPVNEFCKYHTDLDTKYTYELIYLKELLEDQYIDEIKNPYDVENACNPDKSYIYASSKNNLSTSDNSQMEYKVCLVCGDKYSEECLSEEDNYYTFATTCKATYDSTSGTAYNGAWTDRDVYLSFGYEGEIRYGIDEYVYTIGGSAGGQVDANRQTYLANLKISKNVGAKEYKVQAFDGMNGRGNNVSCGTIRVDKAPITNVSVSISAKTTSGTKVNSDTWAMENVVLTANTNPSSSTSGYLYQWYKNGEKFGSQTTSNTLSVTGRGTYKVVVTNRVELAKGTSGKSVTSSDFIVKIDTKKPTCTLAATGTIGKNNIYVSDINIAFKTTGDMETDIDQGSGIVSQTIDVSKITNNIMNKVVTGTVKDAVGRTNTCTLTLSKDDLTPNLPTVTISDSIASGNWHKDNFTIKLSGANNVSQNEYYYSTNRDAVTNANVDSKQNVTTGDTITVNSNTTAAGTTYYYKVCSKSGKCSSVGSYVAKLDKNDPSFAVAATDSIASGSWHKANFTINASGASNVSGTTYYVGTQSNPTTTGSSQSVSANSTTSSGTTYYFKVCSGANRCVTKSYVAKLDKATPTFTVAANDSIASGSWHKDNITITASGASNVSGNTYYSGTGSNPTASGASQSVSSNTSGTTYYFKVCSGAGICDTKSYSAKLDKNDPTFTVAANDSIASGSWHKADFTITASGAGNMSGNTYYVGTGSNPTTTGSSQSVSSNSTTSNGTTYYFKVCSGANRCVTKTYVAKLDKATPTFTVAASDSKASGSWHTSNYTITASGAGNVSGNTYYSGTGSNPTATGASQSVSSNTSGTTYYFKVCSGAGICNTKSYSAKLDKNVPSCTLAVTSGTAGTNGWYRSNVVVGITTSDAGGSNVSTSSTTNNGSVTSNGTSTVNGTVTDAAGNVGTCSTSVSVDKTLPTCSIAATAGTSNVSVKVNCSDTYSTCVTASSSYTTTTTKSYTVYDKAGNSGSCSITVAAATHSSCATGSNTCKGGYNQVWSGCATGSNTCKGGNVNGSWNDCLTGSNTCQGGYVNGTCSTYGCPSGYSLYQVSNQCIKTYAARYLGPGQYDCPNGGSLSGSECWITASKVCTAYNQVWNACKTGSNTCQGGYNQVWSDCATGSNTCQGGYVNGTWNDCLTGSNTCKAGYVCASSYIGGGTSPYCYK